MSRSAASVPYSTRAVVLRVRPLGEKDRICTLFAPDEGQFSVVARGARATKSKLAAVAQPFVSGRFGLVRGKSMDLLTQCEIENARFHLATHPLGAAWAIYCCELCAALPERHGEAQLFGTLELALDALDLWSGDSGQNGEKMRAMLLGHWFEARYLKLLGWNSQLGRCVACEAKIVIAPEAGEKRVAFSASRGGTLCDLCARLDPNRQTPSADALRWLHRLERATGPLQVLGDDVEIAPRALSELRDVLKKCIGVHVEARLKARRFLDDVAAMA